ncbi:MAG: VCBS repeat-containing protein [Candidatus Altiarchaeota archaeon]|nr:VCBS repeat-containing protein [Candidatus Altiarchaeota archaeon]
MRAAVFLLLVLLASSAAGEVHFGLRWDYYAVSGITGVYVFDLDGDGTPEIYGSSYDPGRPVLTGFDANGNVLYSIIIPRPALVDFGNEDVTMVWPADIDGDGLLDVLSASRIVSSGVNSHRLYRLERSFEEDIKRFRTQMEWFYSRTGFVTAVVLVDVTGGGESEIYESSQDMYVRLIDTDGNLLKETRLDGSVWDFAPVYWVRENATSFELVFNNKSVVLNNNNMSFVAGTFRALYGLNEGLDVAWKFPYDFRFTHVYSANVDNDSMPDVFAFSDDNVLHRFSADGKRVWARSVEGMDTNMVSADFDYDGFQDLLFGVGKKVVALNPKGEVVWNIDVSDDVRSLRVADLSKNGTLSVIVGSANGLKVFDYGVFQNESEAVRFKAREMLSYAKERMAEDAYQYAFNYASKAKDAYLSIGDLASAEECQAVMDASKEGVYAVDYYEDAVGFYEEGRFLEAANATLRSFVIYRRMNSTVGLGRVLSLNRSVFETMYLQSNMTAADEHYRTAEASYVNSSFGMALEHANAAAGFYRMAGDRGGVLRAENLANLASGRLKPVSTTLPEAVVTTTVPEEEGLTLDDIAFGAGLSLLSLIVLLYLWTVVGKH